MAAIMVFIADAEVASAALRLGLPSDGSLPRDAAPCLSTCSTASSTICYEPCCVSGYTLLLPNIQGFVNDRGKLGLYLALIVRNSEQCITRDIT